MRRFILLCIIALFVLSGLQLVKAALATEPDFSTALSGGYTLALSLQGDDSRMTANEESQEEYGLATRTTYHFMIYERNRDSGELTLTLYTDPVAGTLYFLENMSAVSVELQIIKQGCSDAVTLREFTYGTAEGATARIMSAGSGFGSESSLYLEGNGLFVQSGRTVRLEPKGNTVYRVEPTETGTAFSVRNGVFTLRTRIAAGGAGKVCYHGAVCTSPLVDWDTPHRMQKIVNFDTTNEYLFLADGHYYKKPSDYMPCAEEEGRFVYKTAASFVHKSAIEPDSGAYLRLLGLYLLYTRLESFNPSGYIPTPCESRWLKTDYNIGTGFYDTRFNIDAVRALIFSERAGTEPRIRETVERALDFYIDFRARHRFLANGSFFVPDYLDANGITAAGHTSLNHSLAEGMALIEAGQQYGRGDYLAEGLQVFDELEKSWSKWLRPNGDLWYGVNRAAEMIRDDYVSVTYNDLVATAKMLDRMGCLERYPGLYALLLSKEAWLAGSEQGAACIVEHP
ncbi:hypothetical protein D7X33_01475 [Butyricicoccus sp. 1XD8-22]|nr:hypothetical protein D7X33_01475 [Butyricicoccus sp. 1XD8-22]